MSSSNNFPYIAGKVFIRSDAALQELGDLLSENIFGGVPFSGLDQHIYDEVPAIFIHILGLRIVLSESGNNHFELSMYPSKKMPNQIEHAYQTVNLSEYLQYLLAYNTDLTCMLEMPTESCFMKSSSSSKKWRFLNWIKK
jgi:hypothetical protein